MLRALLVLVCSIKQKNSRTLVVPHRVHEFGYRRVSLYTTPRNYVLYTLLVLACSIKQKNCKTLVVPHQVREFGCVNLYIAPLN